MKVDLSDLKTIAEEIDSFVESLRGMFGIDKLALELTWQSALGGDYLVTVDLSETYGDAAVSISEKPVKAPTRRRKRTPLVPPEGKGS